MKPRSLQLELIRWIIATTVTISIVAGITAGLIAFFEARELQDEILIQIARSISDDATGNSNNWSSHQADSNIIIQPLKKLNTRSLGIRDNQPDGFATVDHDHTSWRIYIITKAANQRFVVAQQTEVRDELAWANAISAMLPILVTALILLVAIPLIIWSRMKPVALLAKKVDGLSVDNINPLSEEEIPSEISPFVEAINRLLVRARDTIKHQRRFIADASHELRTPVASLSILSENIQAARSEAEREERFELLHRSVARLNTLVNQLLKLARLRNVEADSPSPVSADKVLRDVVTSLHPLAEKKSIDLGVIEITEVQLADFNGGLSQLFENTISNAIYYTPKGGRVDVSLAVDNGKAVFKVIDDGPGIDDKEIDKVFTPFYRVEGNAEPGSGLGLAICAEIAAQLNGKISIANREEGGLILTYIQEALQAE